jgi:hypothetical protein
LFAAAIIFGAGLLIVLLLAFLLRFFLGLVHGRIARRSVIISTDSQQIDDSRRCTRLPCDRRRIMPWRQRPSDRCKNFVS